MSTRMILTLCKRSLIEWQLFLSDELGKWESCHRIADRDAAQQKQVLKAFLDLIKQVINRQ